MNAAGDFRPPRLHLRATGWVILFLALTFVLLLSGAIWLERHSIHAIAPETSALKNQGAALQRAAFAEPDLLPLYGSSELLKRVPDKASQFFANYPTHFAVSPTGRPGCTSLIMLQKIAAATTGRGHKVGVILSPSWFLVPKPNQHGYAGNFSLLQCSHLMFRSGLSWSLRSDIARRLLDYPQTLKSSPVLQSAVQHAARGEKLDRLIFTVLRPLGWLQNVIGDMQDHYATGLAIWRERHRPATSSHPAESLPWNELLTEADGMVKTSVDGKPDPRPHWFASDADFRQTLDEAQEWNDLELLLRTLRELHLNPLVITIPIERRHFESMGIAGASIDAYEQRLAALNARYRFPLAAFADHEGDGKFFADHHDHLSAKGWMYLDKALDDFYHAPRRHPHPRRTHGDEARG
jgi:D-alanine transfer protein